MYEKHALDIKPNTVCIHMPLGMCEALRIEWMLPGVQTRVETDLA